MTEPAPGFYRKSSSSIFQVIVLLLLETQKTPVNRTFFSPFFSLIIPEESNYRTVWRSARLKCIWGGEKNNLSLSDSQLQRETRPPVMKSLIPPPPAPYRHLSLPISTSCAGFLSPGSVLPMFPVCVSLGLRAEPSTCTASVTERAGLTSVMERPQEARWAAVTFGRRRVVRRATNHCTAPWSCDPHGSVLWHRSTTNKQPRL